MLDQESVAIVALVEKQADRVAFAEAQFQAESILKNCEAVRRRLTCYELGRRLAGCDMADAAREEFMVNPMRAER
jgi:hypothetical protein